jgi:hypothetical protein
MIAPNQKPVEVTSRFVNEINMECTNLISKLHESQKNEGNDNNEDDNFFRGSQGSSA